jgi:hypothetical protein
MGRQVGIAATSIDEESFLSFLRETAEIVLIESFAEAIDQLWVESFASDKIGHWTYAIWNKGFPWTPTYGRVSEKAHDKRMIGWYFVANLGTAPVIEFTRSDISKQQYGRIYWAKDFSAPHGLSYDVEAFVQWYDTIIRWVRKYGKKLSRGAYEPYFFPDAWKQMQKLNV